MTYTELKDWIEKESSGNRYLVFPDELINAISAEQAEMLVEEFHKNTFMLLPESEIKFFNWLKDNDAPVWDDLWGHDHLSMEPYIVSINFLKGLVNSKDRGFPICDLTNCDNYYFVPAHMIDKESEMLLDSVRQRLIDKQNLTVAQLLALEISLGPIDIWHFAYKYKLQLNEVKKAVEVLVEDNALVHLKEAEHLASFIEI